MKKQLTVALIVFIISASLAVAPHTRAVSKSIVVPDDYPTIAEAIDNASDGDTIFVRKGIYENPANQTLTINKTIQLVGEDPNETKLIFHPPIIPVQIFTQTFWVHDQPIKIRADWVSLSGFSILSDGGDLSVVGNGVQIVGNNLSFAVDTTGDGTKIINNTLKAILSKGSNQTIINNIIPDGNREYIISIEGSFNTAKFNSIAGSGGGMYLNGSHNIIYENSITATGTQGGLELNGQENIAARNNVSSLVRIGESVPNSLFNIFCGNTITSNLAVTGNNNTFNGNYVQGLVLGNRIADASNNTFYQNNFDFVTRSALPPGEKTFTIWEGVQGPVFLDNGSIGNYYNDYNGSDGNGDNVGDTPYVLNAKDPLNYHYMAEFNVANLTLTDNYPLIEPFDISKVTLNLPEWETLQLPFPVVSPIFSSPLTSPTQEPSIPPSPAETPTPDVTPTPSSSTSPTQQPTMEPSLTPNVDQPILLTIPIGISIVVAAAAIMLVYLKKHKN